MKTKRKVLRKASAKAKCASFEIEINAQFSPHGLASDEVNDVQRKLKNGLAELVAKLPFAHVYPFEVKVR